MFCRKPSNTIEAQRHVKENTQTSEVEGYQTGPPEFEQVTEHPACLSISIERNWQGGVLLEYMSIPITAYLKVGRRLNVDSSDNKKLHSSGTLYRVRRKCVPKVCMDCWQWQHGSFLMHTLIPWWEVELLIFGEKVELISEHTKEFLNLGTHSWQGGYPRLVKLEWSKNRACCNTNWHMRKWYLLPPLRVQTKSRRTYLIIQNIQVL